MTWTIKKAAKKRRVMPIQKPGKSEQTVGTPDDLIDAVEARFGKLFVDLASDKRNAKAEEFITPEQDSLKAKWRDYSDQIMWLNPPFGDIPPWAAKCARTKLRRGGRILLLVPAGVGTNWFAESIFEKALVLFLRSRVKFVGHKQGFPKDLMLCVYGEKPGIELWDWKGNKR
jgi:phage N-6-adenine-methyltransferase